MHCVIDDHTRLAYAEIHPDEKAITCAGFLLRAAEYFATLGIPKIERVMTDNAKTYRVGKARHAALAARPRFTPLYGDRVQTEVAFSQWRSRRTLRSLRFLLRWLSGR